MNVCFYLFIFVVWSFIHLLLSPHIFIKVILT